MTWIVKRGGGPLFTHLTPQGVIAVCTASVAVVAIAVATPAQACFSAARNTVEYVRCLNGVLLAAEASLYRDRLEFEEMHGRWRMEWAEKVDAGQMTRKEFDAAVVDLSALAKEHKPVR